MLYDQIDFVPYKPTEEEHKLRVYWESLRTKSNTAYRLRAVALAAWAQREYTGSRADRVSNRDILQIPMCYPIVNQRLSTIYANPSRAVFKVVDDDKEADVEVLKQVDLYDRQVGCYNSDYQDIEMTAQIEGTCFFRVNWEECIGEQGETVGIPSTKIRRVRMNDFYWDPSARRPRDMNFGIEQSVRGFDDFLRAFLPLDGKDGFKNIKSVLPTGSGSRQYGSIYEEDWEELGRDNWADQVVLWYCETKAMITKSGIKKKSCIIANGVVIYECDKLFTPKVTPNDPDLLMWSKIDGIPTGQMVGMGIPALIRHPQAAFDRFLTLSVAQAELATAPPLFLRATSDQDMDDNLLFPGATIPVRGSGNNINEDYQWLQIPDSTAGAQQLMEKLVNYMTILTGIDIQALFVDSSEKAITTENKRQIQEKLLRFSVIWNEENGFYDMQLRRLRLIQHYYPLTRTFLEDDNGDIIPVERQIKIPISDYEVEEGVKGKGRIKLNFKKGAYTKLDIGADNLRMDVDLVIEGAEMGEERDIIKQKNFIDHLNIIMSMPQLAEKLDPDKTLKLLLKKTNIPEDEVMDTPTSSSYNLHPALKEIAAINLVQALEQQGIRIPEDIPEPPKYEPSEYVRIFSEYMRGQQYAKMTRQSKVLFSERLDFHTQNSMNPYFQELKEKEQEESQAQEGMEAQEGLAPGEIPTPEAQTPEGSLTDSVRTQAGQLAASMRP